MPFAIWGDSETDLRWLDDDGLYAIGRSNCPFEQKLGVFMTQPFVIEHEDDIFDVVCVKVVDITRRFVYFEVLDDEDFSDSEQEETISVSETSGIGGFHEGDYMNSDDEGD